jgi:hypothetical protein
MSPTTSTTPLDAITETEKLAAARMKWWGVYLVREKRRLQGIADRVNAQATAQAVGHMPPPTLPDPTAFQEAVAPDPSPSTPGGETPEEMLVRLDAEIAVEEATAELEAEETEATLTATGEPAEIIPPARWADPSPSGKDTVPSPVALSPEEPPHHKDSTPPPADQTNSPTGDPDDGDRHEQIVTGKASVLSDFSSEEDY